MSKCVPTTKTCNQIAMLLNCGYGQYVKTTYDRTSTHAVYGFGKDRKEELKRRVKAIGGKYIRFVSAADRNFTICCFALEITSEELTAKKAAEEKKAREEAYRSQLFQELAVLAVEAGVTDEYSINITTNRIIHGILDSKTDPQTYFLPMRQPNGKDERRIYDIVRKACDGGVPVIARAYHGKMVDLAIQMNNKIKDEAKRIARKAACESYGLVGLGKCFVKTGA